VIGGALGCVAQALLDVYTIKREIGRLDNFSIGLVGDLANGRTVRSLAYVLSMYANVKMYFVSPDVVRMKDDIKEYLTRVGVDWEEVDDLGQVRVLRVGTRNGGLWRMCTFCGWSKSKFRLWVLCGSTESKTSRVRA
jgi:hypothetical protein